MAHRGTDVAFRIRKVAPPPPYATKGGCGSFLLVLGNIVASRPQRRKQKKSDGEMSSAAPRIRPEGGKEMSKATDNTAENFPLRHTANPGGTIPRPPLANDPSESPEMQNIL